MQEEVHKIERWCRKWQVSLNPIKSKLVLFSKCPRHKDEVAEIGLTIQLFGEIIKPSTEADFLGVIFDARMTWEPQTRKMLTRAYQRLNLLRSISAVTKKPNPKNLLKIYTLPHERCSYVNNIRTACLSLTETNSFLFDFPENSCELELLFV